MSFLTPAVPHQRPRRQGAITRNTSALVLPAMVDHISDAFRAASDDQLDHGERWYWLAHEIAGDRQGAGMLAALSPGCSWERNVALFHEMKATGDCSHSWGDPIEKARLIREGADPADVLKGRKVRSFFTNVWAPDNGGAVTVDRHAFSLALLGMAAESRGRTATMSNREQKALERPGVYVLVSAAYRAAARRYGVPAHVMQATSWLVWRETHAFRTGNSVSVPADWSEGALLPA